MKHQTIQVWLILMLLESAQKRWSLSVALLRMTIAEASFSRTRLEEAILSVYNLEQCYGTI